MKIKQLPFAIMLAVTVMSTVACANTSQGQSPSTSTAPISQTTTFSPITTTTATSGTTTDKDQTPQTTDEITTPATTTTQTDKPTTTTTVTTTDPAVCSHSYSEWATVNEASCKETGSEERTCLLCGESQSRPIAKLEHTLTTTDAVDATCTSVGHTASTYCTLCGTVTVRSTEIQKVDHNYKNEVCTVCGTHQLSDGLEFVIKNGICYVGGIGTCKDTEIIIPTEYNGQNVAGVYDLAFQDQTQITKVKFQSGHTYIGAGAFTGCTSLSEVILPDTLKSIGNYAFNDCFMLEKLDLPDSLKEIESNAFSGTAITTISIPASVTSLTSPFASSNIEMVIFEEGLEVLPADTFIYTSCVKNVILPESLKVIGESAFQSSKNIESINLPSGLTEIGTGAFRDCGWLKEALDLSSVQTVGRYAFYETGITSVKLGAVTLGDSAFKKCAALTKVVLGDGTREIAAAAFADCSSLSELTLPSTVKTFGSQCFYGCSSLCFDTFTVTSDMTVNQNAFCYVKFGTLTVQQNPADRTFFHINATNVIIDEGVTVINDNAFMWAKISTISLPTTLEEIGNSAFYGIAIDVIEIRSAATLTYGCFNNCDVVTLIIPADAVIEDNAFMNTNKLTTIYYGGTTAEWNTIYQNYGIQASDKLDLSDVTVICSDS